MNRALVRREASVKAGALIRGAVNDAFAPGNQVPEEMAAISAAVFAALRARPLRSRGSGAPLLLLNYSLVFPEVVIACVGSCRFFCRT